MSTGQDVLEKMLYRSPEIIIGYIASLQDEVEMLQDNLAGMEIDCAELSRCHEEWEETYQRLSTENHDNILMIEKLKTEYEVLEIQHGNVLKQTFDIEAESKQFAISAAYNRSRNIDLESRLAELQSKYISCNELLEYIYRTIVPSSLSTGNILKDIKTTLLPYGVLCLGESNESE